MLRKINLLSHHKQEICDNGSLCTAFGIFKKQIAFQDFLVKTPEIVITYIFKDSGTFVCEI